MRNLILYCRQCAAAVNPVLTGFLNTIQAIFAGLWATSRRVFPCVRLHFMLAMIRVYFGITIHPRFPVMPLVSRIEETSSMFS